MMLEIENISFFEENKTICNTHIIHIIYFRVSRLILKTYNKCIILYTVIRSFSKQNNLPHYKIPMLSIKY